MKVSDDLHEMLRDLESGIRISDTQFDKIFPVDERHASRIHWTPVAVAMEAVKIFTEDFEFEEGKAFRILDVGSNVGKFCLIGALTSKAHFTGVEIRKEMVEIARLTARRLRIGRVKYQWIDMEQLDWSTFDGIYLYNPFYENIEVSVQIDQKIDLNPKQYERYLNSVEKKLESCRPGTRLVSYYGFGRSIPDTFTPVPIKSTEFPHLGLWIKS